MRDVSYGKTYIYCVRWFLLNNLLMPYSQCFCYTLLILSTLCFLTLGHLTLGQGPDHEVTINILFLDFPSSPCLPGKLPFSFQNAAQRLPVPETFPWSHLYCFIEFITLSLILFLYLVQTSNVALIILHVISFMYFPLEQILRSSKTCLIY